MSPKKDQLKGRLNRFHSLAFEIEQPNQTVFIEESSTKSEIELVDKKVEKNSDEDIKR